MSNPRLTRGRIIIAVCALVVVYGGYTAISGYVIGRRLDSEYEQANREVATLEAKKAYLEAVRNYAASDAYVEQEARRRLGYIREGEVPFVVVSPSAQQPTETSGDWWERLFPR